MTTEENARPGDYSGAGNKQATQTWTQDTTRVRRVAATLDAHVGTARYRLPEAYTSAENGTALGVPEREAAASAVAA